MSIRFDRDHVQQVWQNKAQGKPPEDPLAKALSDDRLSKKEYESLKKEFEAANPGQDFDAFLADALDGQLDARSNPNILSMIQQLGRPGSAASSVSLQLNDARSGFNDPVAISYDKTEWLQAALASDGNKNGRIEGAELQGLQGKVDDALLQKLRAEGSVLTYDTEQHSLTFYPAPDAPSLHGRYRDVKAELDLSLKDIDGISDRSRNDLSGSANGTLRFDWNGPLVNGIRQAVIDKSGGWVDMDARYVPAGDRDGYGPGFVIQARSGWIATRPIVIKSDPQGQLFLESPGFGEWARLKMGEYGLENYALPQLKAMGFDMSIENKDGRIYLRPKALQLNNLPLSAQVAGGGQLNLDLNQRARFSVDSGGITVRLENVPATGSSNVAGPQATQDRNAQGAEISDSIKGRFRAGLNYDPKANRLDTQIVVDRAEAELHLDRQELDQVKYIPTDARKLAGETIDAKMRLQGSYRTVNGSEHEGSLQGQLEITNRQGEETTDLFSRFRTKASQRDPNLAVSLSAVDIRHQKPGQEVRLRAESGKAQATAKGPDLALQRVQAQAKLGADQLAAVRQLLNGQHIASAQFQSALKTAGVTSEQLKILTSGSNEQISRLLSSSELAKKLKTALLNVEADTARVSQGERGVKVEGEQVRVKGQVGDGQGTEVTLDAQANTASGELSPDGKVRVQGQQAEVSAEISSQSADGTLRARTSLKAGEVDVDAQGESVKLEAKDGTGVGEAHAQSAQGASLDLSGSLNGLNATQDTEGVQAQAQSARATAAFRSADGSSLSTEVSTGALSFSQQGEGQWVLSTPDIKGKTQLELQIAELQSVVRKLGKQQVAEMVTASADANKSLLERSGFTPEQITQAQALFENQELRKLLVGSDLLNVLDQGRTLKIEMKAEGNLRASQLNGQGMQVESQSSVELHGQLEDAQGQTLIQGDASSTQTRLRLDDQGLSVTSPSVSGQVQGLRPDGSQFGEISGQTQDLSIQTGEQAEVSLGQTEGSLEYRSEKGTVIQAQTDIRQISFKRQDGNSWSLSVPDIETKAQLEIQVEVLKDLVNKLGSETFNRLTTERDPASMQAALEKAGLSSDKARQATDLLWRPELRSLLATSEFANALAQGQTIKLEVEGKGGFTLSDSAAGGVRLDSKAQVDASGSLSTAEGQQLISGQLQSRETETRFEKGELSISTPDAEIQLEGRRLDGSVFGTLNARSEALKATLGLNGAAVTTGKAIVEAHVETTLDAEKIAEVQKLLTDFRDNLVERLQKLGLSREQFEQILNAFGKEQLEALFKSFKPDAIKGLSQDLGLSPEQIEKTLSLLSDKTFQKLITDFFKFSEMLNDSQAQIHLKAETSDGSWSLRDGQMLARLNQLKAQLDMTTHHEQGDGSLQVSASQESLEFSSQGDQNRVQWGQTQVELQGQLQSQDNQVRLNTTVTASTAEGHLTQQGSSITSSVSDLEIKGQGSQRSQDGSSGEVSGELNVVEIKTQRDEQQPGSSIINVTEIDGTIKTSVTDAKDNQQVSGEVYGGIGSLTVKPDSLQAEDATLVADARAQRETAPGQVVSGSARVTLNSDQMNSSEKDGVSIPQIDFEASGQTSLSNDGKLTTRMRFAADDGQISGIQAQDGTVSIEHIETKGSTDLQTPIVRGQIQGNLSIDGLESTPDKTTAKGFEVDQVQGTLKIKTDRLRDLVAGNKDAQQILETISERWAKRQGDRAGSPNLFTNKEITLQIDKGSWQGDTQDGNAFSGANLTGHLRLPDLHTRLGSGEIDLELRNLNLADDPNGKAQVELAGTGSFKPKQPEFNQSVQSLVEHHMKSIGADLKPTVTFEGGQFKVKIDRWFVDGLISVDFEGDKIQVKVDRAKLLHFISARNLTARFAESQFNNYLLAVDRKEDTLTLSMTEFSEQLLHKDNLQIQNVETLPDNTIKVKFAYTDTKAYNAGYAQRQQKQLDERLFRDLKTGKARSEGDLEDVVEDLDAVRLRRIFQQGSPEQLRKVLKAVGNDYDNILRKTLAGEQNYRNYPVANRAIMAAYLASDSGIFESVDSEERAHIRNLIASLQAGERAAFDRALTQEERQRIEKQLRKR